MIIVYKAKVILKQKGVLLQTKFQDALPYRVLTTYLINTQSVSDINVLLPDRLTIRNMLVFNRQPLLQRMD